jgi:lipoprotein-anchoring transpeptidase ErfK/SrfK
VGATAEPKGEPRAEEQAGKPAEAAPKPVAPPPPRVVAEINLSTQRMTVSVDGRVQHTFAISSGRAGFQTPTGNFRPQWASKM